MPVSSYRELREKIRRKIRDTYGLLWDEPALDRIINEAQREYSILSGSLIGESEVKATRTGVCRYPSDFIEVVRFIGTDGDEKGLFSWRYLDDLYPDFRAETGTEARGLVTDFDGYGKYRIFPKLPEGTTAGKVYYKRLAKANELETRNTEALEQHCYYQVFLLTGKGQASEYYRRFVKLVNEEGENYRGLRNSSPVRFGRYF